MLALIRQQARARPIAALICGWAVTRAVIVAQLAAFPDAFLGDVRLYAVWSLVLREGQFPAGDPFWQYPPGAGILFGLLGRLGPEPVWAFIGLALVADAAIMLLLCRAASRMPADERSWWGPAAWVIGGLAIGPVMLARFDLFPTALAVAALLVLGRPAASGALAGLGGLVKAWPLLILIAMPRRRLAIAALAAIGAMGAAALAIAAWAPGSLAFLDQQRGRGLQVESVAALPYVISGALGNDPDITLTYGAFEVRADAVQWLGLGVTIAGIAMLAVLAAGRILGRFETVPGADLALLAVMTSVATSRVLSPQYAAWLIGIAAAAACQPGSLARPATRLLIAMALVTQVLFPWGYGSYLDTAPYAVALQAARIGLLLAALATLAAAILRTARQPVTSPGATLGPGNQA